MATRIQTAAAAVASGTATISWGSPTTAGGFLLAVCTYDDRTAVITAPTGWTASTSAESITGGKCVQIFYRFFAPVTSSSAFSIDIGGIRVAACEYAGVAYILDPLDDKWGIVEDSATDAFVGDAYAFPNPLYSLNDLLVVGVACDTAALPFNWFTSGFSTVVSASGSGESAVLVDKLTADAFTGITPSWTAATPSQYAMVGLALYPEDAVPEVMRGSVTIRGAATMTTNAREYTGTGGFTLSGNALVVEGFSDRKTFGQFVISGFGEVVPEDWDHFHTAEGSISLSGEDLHYYYLGTGGFNVGSQAQVQPYQTDGGFALTGTPLLKASYVFEGSGKIVFLDDPYLMEGGFTLTGDGTAVPGASVTMNGGFRLTGTAPVALNYYFEQEGRGTIRLRGKATAAITELHIQYDGSGKFKLKGSALSQITYLNLAYDGSGRVRFSGDATEVISTVHLSYDAGGFLTLSGRATVNPPTVGSGGFRVTGLATTAITSLNLTYDVSGNRKWRLSGQASVQYSAYYSQSATGQVMLTGRSPAYGTGHTQDADGAVTLSGLATCLPGAVATATGVVSISGLADADWLVAFYQTASGGLSLSGSALVYPPLHQTGSGGFRLSGAAASQRGWIVYFYSPQWWEKTGRFKITGAALVLRGFVGTPSGSVTIGGEAGFQGPVGGVGSFTLSGVAGAAAGPSFTASGSIGAISGEQDPPVLGQRVYGTGSFSINGSALFHNIAYVGLGPVTLSGAAYAISLINFGNQDAAGSIGTISGIASHKIGYASPMTGGPTLTGSALAAWGYSYRGSGSVVISGTGATGYSVTPQPAGEFTLTGRATVRMVFRFLYDASGSISVGGTGLQTSTYAYKGSGKVRLSGIASAESHTAFTILEIGSFRLAGRAHVVSTAYFTSEMSGEFVFGGSNDRQTADYVAATGALGLRGEVATHGPDLPAIPTATTQQRSAPSCDISQSAFLNLLKTDSFLYRDLAAAGLSGWSVIYLDCDTRTARLDVGGRTIDVTLPQPVETSNIGTAPTSPRVFREVDPEIFRMPARPGGIRRVVAASGRAAVPAISKASLLSRIPANSPLRRELEKVGPNAWEVVDRGRGRYAIKFQGRYVDLAVPG